MPTLTKLRPLRVKMLNASVIDLLRDRIFSGKIAAGERLNESELARQLKTSRSPIREALHSLEEQGIVTNNPRRGMFVVELTRRDVQNVNEIRLILEAEALRRCKQYFDSQLERQLSQLLEKLEAMDPLVDASLRRTDLEFHRTIWNHCENEPLEAALVRLTTPLLVYAADRVNKGEGRPGVDHRSFLDFLRGESQQTAREVVFQHLRAGYDFVEPPPACETGAQRGGAAIEPLNTSWPLPDAHGEP